MALHRRNGVWIAALVLVVWGCRSPDSRFYTLASLSSPGRESPVGYGVMVGPVSVPSSVDRPEFVVQVAQNRVALDELHRWAAPLDESVARVVAGNLSALLGTKVVPGPLANFDPAYRVAIDVQRFESIPGQTAVLEAVWTVQRTSDGTSRTGRTVAQEGVDGKEFDALAAAHSRALATLSSDIAAALRAMPPTTRKR
jgi:uncharacterized lipoprotein YmbA